MATAHAAVSQSPDEPILPLPGQTFGALLKRYRLAAGLTQDRLAERAKLSARGISDLERGVRRQPRRDTLVLLADALELSPSARSIFQAAGTAAAAFLVSPALRPCNLYAPPTQLIGRKAEVADVVARLKRKDVRLLTLTGAGGVGKTRLAQEVGLTLQHRYAARVWQVELASLRDADLVAAAVARVLGLGDAGGASALERVVNHLHETPALLLLDNFEHLPAAAEFVATLHASCPKLRLLVTSRAPLHLRGEHEVLVRPFTVPDPERLPSLPELKQYPAVSLFIERARAVQSSFALTSLNAAAVAAICRRLDGLPLALELAANWVRMFLPKALLVGLERRLWLLTSGAWAVPERQRTLHASIAWSYHLLSPGEKALFRRLAVFVGGCSISAASFMCRAGDDMGGSLLDHIAALLDHNLLYRPAPTGAEEEAEPRFGMLETIREYGIECLISVGELGRSRERHATYFLAIADSEAQAGAPDNVRPTRLDRDRANLRAALEYRRAGAQEPA